MMRNEFRVEGLVMEREARTGDKYLDLHARDCDGALVHMHVWKYNRMLHSGDVFTSNGERTIAGVLSVNLGYVK